MASPRERSRSVEPDPARRSLARALHAWVAAHPRLTLWILSAVGVLIYSRLLGRHLGGPLMGQGDIPIWEYLGFYLSRNFRWTPLPHLSLVNDQSFFPYGTNHVFQPWAIERDGFFAVAFSLLGPGPWLQIYYLLTVFITIVGTYRLLEGEFGPRRAALAAVMVSFLNFYATHKYPAHLHIAVVHRTTLS